jgi:branched-chain amino acid transport system ATP-binding protein
LVGAETKPDGMTSMAPLLQLDNVTIRFGGLTAVSQVSATVKPGELVGLIGPNGAGKTTVFNMITGVYQPTEGTIRFNGEPTARLKPFKLTELGIARTFQNIRLFPSLSVFDNVRVAFHLHLDHSAVHSLTRGPKFVAEEAQIREAALDLLRIFKLERLQDEPSKSLSYGDQRRLEIIRALATRPKLLLLDEPAAGMNPAEKLELMRLIEFIRDKFKLAILLVEHDMKVVMGVCQRIHVLEYGRKIAEGTPLEIRSNPAVIAAYLGQDHAGT